MNRLTLALSLILSLVVAGEAVAAPDMKRIGDEATAGILDLAGARAVIQSFAAQRVVDMARVEKAAAAATIDQETIRAGNERIDALQKEVERVKSEASDGRMLLLCLIVGGVGSVFLVCGCLGFVLDVGPAAAKCLVVAVILISTAVAIAKYDRQFGWLGLGVAAVGTVGGLVLILNDVRRHKAAGVDLGTGLQVIRDSGKFDADQLAYIEQTLYTAGSKVADKLRAIGAGVSLKSLLARLKPGKAAA